MSLDVIRSIDLVGVHSIHGDFKVVERVVLIRRYIPSDVVAFKNFVFIERKRVLECHILDISTLERLLLGRALEIV